MAVSEVIVHENWDPKTFNNDIALIRLSNPLDLDPVKLPSVAVLKQILNDGVIGFINGWGKTRDLEILNDSMREIKVQVTSRNYCNSPSTYGGRVLDSMFCAKSLIPEVDACQGFGGSPLVIYGKKSELRIAGIVSWGKAECDRSNAPSVYTDLTNYIEWIVRKTNIVIGE